MRNILLYPVNEQDVEKLLNAVVQEEREFIGSMSPYIAQKMLDFLKDNPETMQRFLDSCRIKEN